MRECERSQITNQFAREPPPVSWSHDHGIRTPTAVQQNAADGRVSSFPCFDGVWREREGAGRSVVPVLYSLTFMAGAERRIRGRAIGCETPTGPISESNILRFFDFDFDCEIFLGWGKRGSRGGSDLGEMGEGEVMVRCEV